VVLTPSQKNGTAQNKIEKYSFSDYCFSPLTLFVPLLGLIHLRENKKQIPNRHLFFICRKSSAPIVVRRVVWFCQFDYFIF